MDYGDKVVASGILPGNKILKTINVTGSGPDNAEPITATIILTPDVTGFGSHVKYTIYAIEKSTIDTSSICESPKPTVEDGMYYDAMECDTSSLGTPILSGTFERKKAVTQEIEVTSTTNTTYYLLIEYENDPNGQDEEQGHTFTINIDFQATYEGPSISQTFIVDGEEVYDLPLKQEYYEVAVTCSDNIDRTWNYETWSLNIEEDLEESCSCSLEFNKNFTKYLECMSGEDGEIVKMDHPATTQTPALTDYRYVGANPNNYVCLEESGECSDDQLYRIIGVIPTQSTTDGEYENRIKLIKATSYGSLAWNSSNINDWKTSSLKNTLNTTYWNSISGYQKYIDDTKWYLGGAITEAATSEAFYNYERGTAVWSGRSTSVVAKVGLMYPSDYGFAVGGSVRSACLPANLKNYNNSCMSNDWLFLSAHQWTIFSLSGNASSVLGVYNVGILNTSASEVHAVHPVFFLKPNIEITDGFGTKEQPFLVK